MKIYSIIPARGGSKGVPKKNLRCLGGYSLIAYSICASKLTKFIQRTIVSTDSQEIAEVSRKYGAETPFLRPIEIAQDNSTDLELFQHAYNEFREKENIVPELLVHLRPTAPLRIPLEIDRAIDYLRQRPDASSLRSAYYFHQPVQKMFYIDEEGFFRGFFPDDPRPEYHNLPRQSFPKTYCPNGYVDIVIPDVFQKTNSLHGSNMLAFVTPFIGEVDSADDFEYLENQLSRYGNPVYKYLTEHFPKDN